ncbi:hypothetical protein [Glacieibacterium frigidum]|uniref:Permease n=1 Tax=Glacieibacterium frigidum TaxID=2593303 RepID=A0A552UJ89_9SPHN|nr:hypothetical protein [Glacieibacterium frigidum]TRW18298.1 hypothetical protein FMM06_09455 [Glacieibacterium frigidum]
MGILGLLRSLDELLYELVSWLLFFPLTLWRSLFRPARMMNHGAAAPARSETQPYLDGLSPPLFLFLAMVVAHAAELILVGPSEIVRSTRGVSALVDSDTSLVMMRALLFSVFPLTMATWLLVRKAIVVDRDTLRPPFFAQCYAAAAFALFFSVGWTMLRTGADSGALTGLVLISVSLIWYCIVQIRWFARHLGQSVLRSLADATGAMVLSSVIVFVVGSLFT